MITLKKTTGKIEDAVRSLWLAGFGVYSKNIDVAHSCYEKSSGFFDTLVVRGEKLEADAKTQLNEAQATLKSSTVKLQKQYDELVAKSKKTFSDSTDLELLKVKLKELGTKVEKLVKA